MQTSLLYYLYAILYYDDYKLGLLGSFLARSLILYITPKFLYKIKQAFKQASFRCEKFQASKPRLSGLACLLNSKSARVNSQFTFLATFNRQNPYLNHFQMYS